MSRIFRFSRPLRFAGVGVINTIIHASVLFFLYSMGVLQATANLLAFLFASTVSYLANGAYTFNVRPSVGKYVLFLALSSACAYIFGAIGDRLDMHPLATMTLFAAFSYIVGYFGGKWWVFVE